MMPRNTLLQRAKIYKALIRLIDKEQVFFICCIMDIAYGSNGGMRIALPELWSIRPDNIPDHGLGAFNSWYSDNRSGMQHRKKKLQQAYGIAMAKHLYNKSSHIKNK